MSPERFLMVVVFAPMILAIIRSFFASWTSERSRRADKSPYLIQGLSLYTFIALTSGLIFFHVGRKEFTERWSVPLTAIMLVVAAMALWGHPLQRRAA